MEKIQEKYKNNSEWAGVMIRVDLSVGSMEGDDTVPDMPATLREDELRRVADRVAIASPRLIACRRRFLKAVRAAEGAGAAR